MTISITHLLSFHISKAQRPTFRQALRATKEPRRPKPSGKSNREVARRHPRAGYGKKGRCEASRRHPHQHDAAKENALRRGCEVSNRGVTLLADSLERRARDKRQDAHYEELKGRHLRHQNAKMKRKTASPKKTPENHLSEATMDAISNNMEWVRWN